MKPTCVESEAHLFTIVKIPNAVSFLGRPTLLHAIDLMKAAFVPFGEDLIRTTPRCTVCQASTTGSHLDYSYSYDCCAYMYVKKLENRGLNKV